MTPKFLCIGTINYTTVHCHSNDELKLEKARLVRNSLSITLTDFVELGLAGRNWDILLDSAELTLFQPKGSH